MEPWREQERAREVPPVMIPGVGGRRMHSVTSLSQVQLDERKVQGLLQAPTAGWVSMDECEPQSHHLSPAGSLLKKPSVLVHTIPGPQPFQWALALPSLNSHHRMLLSFNPA